MKSYRTSIKLLITLLLAGLIVFTVWLAWQKEALPVEPTPVPHFKVNIPDKALLKNYVTVSVEAVPGTKCELIYIPSSGEVYKMDATSDAISLCKWRWKIDESDGNGKARLIFTVDGVSDTHFMQIFADF